VQQLETVDIEGVYEVYQRCVEETSRPSVEGRAGAAREQERRGSIGLAPLAEERALSGKATPYTEEPRESIATFRRISSLRKVNKNPLARKCARRHCFPLSPYLHKFVISVKIAFC
jgi:phosphoenolpyruvate carboxylase